MTRFQTWPGLFLAGYLFYLAALILYLLQLYPREVSSVSISPTLLGAFEIMVVGETVPILRMWHMKPVLVSILRLSLGATLASTVRVAVDHQPLPCSGPPIGFPSPGPTH